MALRLIVGDDPVLVGESVGSAIDELVGDGDRSLMLEILTETDYRTEDSTFEPTRLIDAARTPAFLTDKRVVVGPTRQPLGRQGTAGARSPNCSASRSSPPIL